ncbi:MBL fold metallo-hydrolase [Oceanirhabdus sp. W0125-5]|uniref:MBL fold metallo-hydrolase n=1 Tax=Oceanirhabdus sp. W0125-5 TaxID=2999116 RepID=UPI0022F2E004|nr:MBL fold metallo-hydrolase [Oceanirhabdus sp. W0125-5]WBW96141.1 MBL fold metallo-hydrolase [Oceanirhabdus sp. W0125-5]
MNIDKIIGNTYMISAPTNIGIYTFKNKDALIIDTGTGKAFGKKILKIINENQLKGRYIINTHNHSDHCGGNSFIKENCPNLLIYASYEERLLIENYELGAFITYGGNSIEKMKDKNKFSKVDNTIEQGKLELNNKAFEVISLPGHTSDGIGIITPDNVAFLGDSIFSESILKKYSLAYVFNIEAFLDSLEKIKSLSCQKYVLGHGDKVYNDEEMKELIEINRNNIYKYEKEICDALNNPMTQEDLMEHIFILNDLNLNQKQYYLNRTTMNGYITYLLNKEKIESTIESGKLYFYTKE